MRFWVYFAVSTAIFFSAVACTVTTYPNYFSALVGLSDTALGVGIVINFALSLTLLWTKMVIALFLNKLTTGEMQSVYQRGWIFFCNSLLYWGTVNGDLYMNPFNLGVCLLSILVIFVLHWVCRMRVKGLQAVVDTQLTWPKIMNITRLGSLCLLLFASDVLLCYTTVQSFKQHKYALLLCGLFIVDQLEMSITFCGEFAVNVASLVYLHYNPDEDDWEPAKMLSSVCRLFSSTVAVMGHALFVYVFGFRISDIGSVVGRASRLSEHIRGATKILTAKSEILEFTALAKAADLDRDNTCVICREEMELAMAQDAKRAPRKLHCGHTMHAKCLTAWISQSATCPTCRQNVRKPVELRRETETREEEPEPVFVDAVEAHLPNQNDHIEVLNRPPPEGAAARSTEIAAVETQLQRRNPQLYDLINRAVDIHERRQRGDMTFDSPRNSTQEVPVVMQGPSNGVLGGLFEFELQ